VWLPFAETHGCQQLEQNLSFYGFFLSPPIQSDDERDEVNFTSPISGPCRFRLSARNIGSSLISPTFLTSGCQTVPASEPQFRISLKDAPQLLSATECVFAPSDVCLDRQCVLSASLPESVCLVMRLWLWLRRISRQLLRLVCSRQRLRIWWLRIPNRLHRLAGQCLDTRMVECPGDGFSVIGSRSGISGNILGSVDTRIFLPGLAASAVDYCANDRLESSGLLADDHLAAVADNPVVGDGYHGSCLPTGMESGRLCNTGDHSGRRRYCG